MARFKNHLIVVIGFAVAGMIGAAFGTGTAQAVVSTLVSVVNPGTSPVQTNSVNVTDPGRIAYRVTIDVTPQCSGATACVFVFPAVPAGHRVVVEHISSNCASDTASAPALVDVFDGDLTAPIIASLFVSSGAPGIIAFDQPVLFYIDSSNLVTILVQLFSSHFATGLTNVTLTGYELDCTMAACAPIATQ